MGDRIVVVGASLSGINALRDLVARLPANVPAPIFVTQHVAAHSPGVLPEILTPSQRPCGDSREPAFSVFGALIEEATLAKRMRADPNYGDDIIADRLGGRIALLEQEAAKVSEWLHLMTGLVEPEPRERHS